MTARTALAVSPHLDDAAFSVGATLAELVLSSFDVHVLTLFTAVPDETMSAAARSFHGLCDLPCDPSAEAIRRREDVDAMGHLGTVSHHVGLPDAVYRRRSDGNWLCQHERCMFDESLPDEPDVRSAVTEAVAEIVRSIEPDLLLTCAAIGGHVDHVITRCGALAAADVFGLPVLLWEDLPYAVGQGPAVGRRRALTRFPQPEAWERKWRAVESYASQTRMFWPGGGGCASLETHARRRGDDQRAELLWDRRASDLLSTDQQQE